MFHTFLRKVDMSPASGRDTAELVELSGNSPFTSLPILSASPNLADSRICPGWLSFSVLSMLFCVSILCLLPCTACRRLSTKTFDLYWLPSNIYFNTLSVICFFIWSRSSCYLERRDKGDLFRDMLALWLSVAVVFWCCSLMSTEASQSYPWSSWPCLVDFMFFSFGLFFSIWLFC